MCLMCLGRLRRAADPTEIVSIFKLDVTIDRRHLQWAIVQLSDPVRVLRVQDRSLMSERLNATALSRLVTADLRSSPEVLKPTGTSKTLR